MLESPVPVFADATGRRARWVRAAAGVAGALLVTAIAAVAFTLMTHVRLPGLGALGTTHPLTGDQHAPRARSHPEDSTTSEQQTGQVPTDPGSATNNDVVTRATVGAHVTADDAGQPVGELAGPGSASSPTAAPTAPSPTASKAPNAHANARATAKPSTPRSPTASPNPASGSKGANKSDVGADHAKKPSPSPTSG